MRSRKLRTAAKRRRKMRNQPTPKAVKRKARLAKQKRRRAATSGLRR